MIAKFLRCAVALALILLAPIPARAASLLPNGEQVFLDNNGVPLASGSVTFYVPSSTTPKDTWKDSGQSILNINPVPLDLAGRAIIYGSGSYRQIVKDSLGNTIWDQLTADPTGAGATSWGGTSTGSANAQVVTTSGFSGGDGQQICFIAGFTNTGPMTLQPSSSSAIPVRRDTPSGPLQLAGGEVVVGNAACALYDITLGAFHLIDNPQYFFGILSALPSATTTSLGTITSHNASITGTTTITSFGSSATTAYPIYQITFAGALTLTYNATSLILPGSANILTAAGDTAVAMYLGSGNWKVLAYSALAPRTAPNIQTFTSGAAATYTTATGNQGQLPLYLRVRMIGGGGGGGATNTNTGSNGVATSFASWVANPGTGGFNGATSGAGGAGGTGGADGTGTSVARVVGTRGQAGNNAAAVSVNYTGGAGGGGPWGGAGQGATQGTTGAAAAANTGSGGQGGGSGGSQTSGGGGGAGEYVEFIIASPAATYTYTVGTGGAAGAAGSVAGGAGAAGRIEVTGYFQ